MVLMTRREIWKKFGVMVLTLFGNLALSGNLKPEKSLENVHLHPAAAIK